MDEQQDDCDGPWPDVPWTHTPASSSSSTPLPKQTSQDFVLSPVRFSLPLSLFLFLSLSFSLALWNIAQ